MRTSSVGAINKSEAGVTLLELLVVVVLIAIVAGLTYPSAAAGLDSLRLRSASDKVVAFLNTALERADRRQQVIELRIAPGEGALSARSADASFERTLELPDFIHIVSVQPALVADSGEQRRFLMYPGGTAPRLVIELESKDGRKRRVIVDPLTAMPHAEAE
ncbi:MAG TPA: prepilin-type N-terminal cleavage/methylation domain-containing protein [Bryobacteraceae bacterium]|jgi:prepilin-type N-terminal cleavage/methylation domain-containing protein